MATGEIQDRRRMFELFNAMKVAPLACARNHDSSTDRFSAPRPALRASRIARSRTRTPRPSSRSTRRSSCGTACGWRTPSTTRPSPTASPRCRPAPPPCWRSSAAASPGSGGRPCAPRAPRAGPDRRLWGPAGAGTSAGSATTPRLRWASSRRPRRGPPRLLPAGGPPLRPHARTNARFRGREPRVLVRRRGVLTPLRTPGLAAPCALA